MLELTDQAKQVIKGILEDNDLGPSAGFRITAGGDGNGDTEIAFDLADQAEEGDEAIRVDGATVFLDAAAAQTLADMRLDVHEHGDHFHFSLEEQES